MKKKFYGSDDVISVYKFMEMCGLHCRTKGNLYVSHEIMMRKLRDRNKKFEDQIIVPEVVPFHLIIKDDVKSGKIILVRDDNKIIEAYRIPILDYSVQMTEEERRTIRENLIQEQLEKITENIIKPGYQKYLYRKSKKNTEINQEDFTEDEEYEVTEKKVRMMKLDRKRHY